MASLNKVKLPIKPKPEMKQKPPTKEKVLNLVETCGLSNPIDIAQSLIPAKRTILPVTFKSIKTRND